MKTSITILMAVFALHQAHSAVIHSYDAADATGGFFFPDSVGVVGMAGRNTSGASSATTLGSATTSATNLTDAFTVPSSNVIGFTRTPLTLATYTFEIWTRLPGGTNPSASAVIFESGGGNNGFGIFASSGGTLQFASYSGSGSNNNLISLSTSTLDTSDYLQVVGVYNTSNNQLTFQIKDVDGVTLSGTDSSGTLGTGTGNMFGLFFPSGSTNTMASDAYTTAGGYFAIASATTNVNPYRGEIALFNIYNNDAIANGDVLASFNAVVIPEPSSALLLGAGVAGLVLLHRRRGIVRG